MVLPRGRDRLPRRGHHGHRRRPGRDGRRQPQPGGGRHPDPRTRSRGGRTSKATAAGSSWTGPPCAPSARTAPAPGPTSTPPAPPNAAPAAGRPSGSTTARTRWMPRTRTPSCPAPRAARSPPAPPTAAGCRSSPTTPAARPCPCRSLGLTAANFWRAGRAGPLTASAPASVLVRRRGRTATLSVSEPPRTGEALEIVWDRPVRRVVRADPGVEVLATGRRLRVRVTPGMACATHECEVTLS